MYFGPTWTDRILGVTVLGSPVTPINTVFFALCNSIGSAGLSFSEPVAAQGYARQIIVFGAPSNRRVTNINSLLFPAASTPWGSIPHIALFDVSSIGAGTMIAYGTLAATKTVITSVIVGIGINSITYRLE